MCILIPMHLLLKAAGSLRKDLRVFDDAAVSSAPQMRSVLLVNDAGHLAAMHETLTGLGVDVVHTSATARDCVKGIARIGANTVTVAGDARKADSLAAIIQDVRHSAGQHIGIIAYMNGQDEFNEGRFICSGADLVLHAGVDLGTQRARLAALGRRLARYMRADTYREFYLDMQSQKAYYYDYALALSGRYFELLKLLVTKADTVVSLEDCVAMFHAQLGIRVQSITVVTMVHRLRSELGTIGLSHKLRTIRHKGYLWDSA